MTAEEIRRMEERVAQVRAEMERACRAAGRAPGEVLLCAASKTQNSETVRAAAALDIDLFGENRVQELCEKYAAGAYSGKPLHFIGHLQTNKVRQVVGRACMIESVGSHRLLECVAAEAQKQGIRQDILVEINIGGRDKQKRHRARRAARPSGMRPCFALPAGARPDVHPACCGCAGREPPLLCTDARPVRAGAGRAGRQREHGVPFHGHERRFCRRYFGRGKSGPRRDRTVRRAELSCTVALYNMYYKGKTAPGYSNPGAVFQIPRNRSSLCVSAPAGGGAADADGQRHVRPAPPHTHRHILPA